MEQATDTAVFEAGAGAIRRVPDVFRQSFACPAIVVADTITFDVAGQRVQRALESSEVPTLQPFVFPGSPMLHADLCHAVELRDRILPTDAVPVAVGAGTINDIVKRAAHEAGRRYMVVATAASVDGYSAFGAALSQDGFKKSMECRAPLAIVADIEALRDAPPDMTAAGYADLAGKVTAGADWIIADIVGADPVDPDCWDMVQADLRKWIAEPAKLVSGDEQAFEYLFEGLTLSGFAMQALQRSRPASGSEHVLAHTWEMRHVEKDGEPVSHGFKVAIGALAATALMEALLDFDVSGLDIEGALRAYPTWERREADIRAEFTGGRVLARVREESRLKHLTPDRLRGRIELVCERWDEMRERVLAQIIPYHDLKARFTQAGCPVTPAEIGLTRQQVVETFSPAQKIRNRYTVLDLAFELGLLGERASRILASADYLR